ncbi:Excision repair cross-complementation group 1, partial [Podila humilis]
MNDPNSNNTQQKPKLFKALTPEETLERRRKLESHKPALLFKPKMFPPNSDSAMSATNSVTIHSTSSSSISGGGAGCASFSQMPDIVSSRHVQQAKQPDQQLESLLHGDQKSFSTETSSSRESHIDEFDELDSLDFTDDIFDLDEDDTNGSLSKATLPTASVSTTLATSAFFTPATSLSSTPSSSAALGEINDGSSHTIVAARSMGAAVGMTPPVFTPKSKTTIVIRTSQQGNPLLQFIRNVPYEFGNIVPDFQVGLTSCILFLSIRYHRLHPEYIFNRIAYLGKTFALRVILILVDV